MEKFLIRNQEPNQDSPYASTADSSQPQTKQRRVEHNLEDLPGDPGLRRRISDYSPNEQDYIRRAYLQKGPCQPANHLFPQTRISGKLRRFNPAWFVTYPSWLEYSVEKDAAYCLYCYLFKPHNEEGGGDSFTTEGFRNWKRRDKLEIHVGGPSSAHNRAREKAENLLKQKQSIQTALSRQSDRSRVEYRTRLYASIESIRYLLRQGLAFRGHDESCDARNQGNFIELLRYLSNNSDDVKSMILKNAPENHKLTSPDIQKDIVRACAMEVSNAILEDLGDSCFALLVDESRDVSTKEQMAIVLRYIDKRGRVVERFFGLIHITDTNALTLLAAIEAMLAKHGLSLSNLRGQGYDGASNMRGEFNGLKTLILRQNASAFYIHCFAHQLQLALVAVAKHHSQIELLFSIVSNISNVVGASAKRRDVLREKHATKILEALQSGEVTTGKGLNQELALKRPGDTRWSSHYHALANLTLMYSSIIEVLRIIETTAVAEKRGEALSLLVLMQTFEFVFCVHLMRDILGLTNELSQALQRRDQDIVNAMKLVQLAKKRLQDMRSNGWDKFLDIVSSFAAKHDIDIPNMDEKFVPQGRSRRNAQDFTNLHHYRVDMFYTVIDMQLQELNNRFNEANTELLLCAACFNPSDGFLAFHTGKLVRLAEFYPEDFSTVELLMLQNQLETYILDMRSDDEFLSVKGITGLGEKLVDRKKDGIYPLVYRLLKLTLTLPIATASVERAFSAMNIVKSKLRNKMGDEWLNDCLLTYIESELFEQTENDVIAERFQNMKTRRGQL